MCWTKSSRVVELFSQNTFVRKKREKQLKSRKKLLTGDLLSLQLFQLILTPDNWVKIISHVMIWCLIARKNEPPEVMRWISYYPTLPADTNVALIFLSQSICIERQSLNGTLKTIYLTPFNFKCHRHHMVYDAFVWVGWECCLGFTCG